MLLEQEDWLQKISTHPIFSPSLHHTPPHPSASFTFVVVNQTDLIVAAGSELRFLSLPKFKASSAQNATPINYQLLRPNPPSAMPIGPITHLIPNAKPRLLALCSSDQVSVLSLPRPEEQSDSKSTLDCYVTSVGPTIGIQVHHAGIKRNPTSFPRVMKLLWHESSHHSSTLLILYSSGIVHEYDVSRDAKNPAQIIDFNSLSPLISDESTQASELSPQENGDDDPSIISRFENISLNSINRRTKSTPLGSFPSENSITQNKYRKSASRQSPASKRHILQVSSRSGTYGPADQASTTAVSMCFGTGTGDWGPLTLYCIMQNGDMYAICPYLPKNAVIPLSYRNSLLFFLTAKLESISNSAADGSLLVELQNRLYQSLDYLNLWHDVPDHGLDDDFELDNPVENRSIRHSKLASHLRPLRQGPFLMVPSPIENNQNIEETVSDLVHFRYPPATLMNKQLGKLAVEPISDSNADSVGVFLIAYQSRIDVCLEVEKIEPRWVPSDTGLSPDITTNSELPMLITYECIDLGLNECLIDPRSLENNDLNMVFDVRYNDTIYVYHRLGLHAISTLKWVHSLTERLPKNHDSEGNERLLKATGEKTSSEVVWVFQTRSPEPNNRVSSTSLQPSITSLCVIDDAYLGYAMLAMTSDTQLIALQLHHRMLTLPMTSATPNPAPSSFSAPSLQISTQPFIPKSTSHPSYVGYLKERWQVPSLLHEPPSKTLGPKLKPPTDATISTALRYAGKASTEINQYIRRLIEAVNSGQDRLKLLIDEYHRQLDQVSQAPEKLDGKQARAFSEGQIERIRRIAASQTALIQRADHFLQRLTDDRNRSLSKEESRWFAELNRMKSEVQGEGDRKGLLNEIEQLKKQLNITKSNVLSEIKRRRESMIELSSRSSKLSAFPSSNNDSYHTSNGRRDSSSLMSTLSTSLNGNTGKLGESQIIPIYHKLAQANSCIIIIKDQITKINSALSKN